MAPMVGKTAGRDGQQLRKPWCRFPSLENVVVLDLSNTQDSPSGSRHNADMRAQLNASSTVFF